MAAAAERFWTLGYHQVGMADIAAAVGIAPSALYRHFRGKQELLLTIFDEHLTRLEQLTPDADLLGGIAELALRRREFGGLWEREAGHLPEPERRAVRHRLRAMAGRVAVTVASLHPDDPAPDADDPAVWAVLAVLDSPSHHRTAVPAARFERLLTRAASAVAATRASTAAGATPGRPDTVGLRAVSRREALLAAAIRLFGDRGYPSVGMSDIAAAAGITGPSIYKHYAGKTELLAAALSRGDEALWLGLHRALAATTDPAEALRRLIDDYTAFAVDHPGIVSILRTEAVHLPEDRRTIYHQHQREYVTEWVGLLGSVRPDLTAREARVCVHAALAVVNSLCRIHRLRGRPGLAEETAALAGAVLLGHDPDQPRAPALQA